MLKSCKVSMTGTVGTLFVILAAVIVSHQEENASPETDAVKIESGVVHELSDQNFTDFLQDKVVLVKFYAPWCGHCKALESAYKEAATKVANTNVAIYFAKIDATIHNISAKNCNISGYPTLKLFRNSQHDFIDYNGGRSADDISNWVLRKSGPQTISLKTVEDFKDFNEKNQISVYAYFASGQSDPNFKVYNLVAESFEKISFAVLESQELAKEFNSDAESFMVINVNGERLTYTEEWSTKTMKKFVGIFTSPKVVDFNHDTAQVIFGSDIVNHTLLFLSRKNGDYEKINDLTAAIDEYRGKVMFVSIDTDIEDHQRILEFFGVKSEDGATIRIISFAEEEMLKYRLLNEGFSADNLKESLKLFVEGKLQQTLSSENVPDNWDKAPVKILVGYNFEEVLSKIRKPSEEGLKYLLVEFYAPWCAHCKRLEPIYEQLALSEEFKDSSKYWIAKMDSTKNEVTQAKIYTFPTIRLYWRKESGDLEQMEYSGERNLESMKQFILSGGQSDQNEQKISDDIEDDNLPLKDEL